MGIKCLRHRGKIFLITCLEATKILLYVILLYFTKLTKNQVRYFRPVVLKKIFDITSFDVFEMLNFILLC